MGDRKKARRIMRVIIMLLCTLSGALAFGTYWASGPDQLEGEELSRGGWELNEIATTTLPKGRTSPGFERGTSEDWQRLTFVQSHQDNQHQNNHQDKPPPKASHPDTKLAIPDDSDAVVPETSLLSTLAVEDHEVERACHGEDEDCLRSRVIKACDEDGKFEDCLRSRVIKDLDGGVMTPKKSKERWDQIYPSFIKELPECKQIFEDQTDGKYTAYIWIARVLQLERMLEKFRAFEFTLDQKVADFLKPAEVNPLTGESPSLPPPPPPLLLAQASRTERGHSDQMCQDIEMKWSSLVACPTKGNTGRVGCNVQPTDEFNICASGTKKCRTIEESNWQKLVDAISNEAMKDTKNADRLFAEAKATISKEKNRINNMLLAKSNHEIAGFKCKILKSGNGLGYICIQNNKKSGNKITTTCKVMQAKLDVESCYVPFHPSEQQQALGWEGDLRIHSFTAKSARSIAQFAMAKQLVCSWFENGKKFTCERLATSVCRSEQCNDADMAAYVDF